MHKPTVLYSLYITLHYTTMDKQQQIPLMYTCSCTAFVSLFVALCVCTEGIHRLELLDETLEGVDARDLYMTLVSSLWRSMSGVPLLSRLNLSKFL